MIIGNNNNINCEIEMWSVMENEKETYHYHSNVKVANVHNMPSTKHYIQEVRA